ncbi:hypothetical protein SYNTR_1879 [Candidatus Syntrophocurvum alkaliphilum]|uniref:ISLre2 family transposase n=1 Tax=Candidatus Syntrophocurvum alkaliphilum TaxID=2293317 RepID=A0A6I6DJK4_9FIRM|nr:ISLre2 family transposase [Candidatus Syntrophocurvum alkaliphilum]QGT99581.1 hypothetical protein SYNTR_0988 [Candidatus Syntrophocurvum alkaliphilum]QGU00023.1 hypothetical protein SYNTR_1429 [Candidatus Syntrophocurvum alkaliphilum]QGU00473.1 hypothetical protein SYNTR_1879 [Candidatus Syntrophocurvum alkaliphilum]
MDKIIHEILGKIIRDNTKNLENLFTNHKSISDFILQTKKMLDEVGVLLVEQAFELADEMIKESVWRKENWYIQRNNDNKSLTTIFGVVNYNRTYYKNKHDNSYSYLSDEALGIDPHQRMDLSMKSQLIERTLDLSYKKSGESVAESVIISDQSVMNSIRELGSVENTSAKITKEKKQLKTLYIEADEDHVPMQDGSNREMRLVYVHEGKEKVNKDRYKLINCRYFSGEYNDSEELWLEVAEYLDKAYDIDKVEKIYLSGDGAQWIKEGLNWIKGSLFVLDKFHLAKYIKTATGHMPHLESMLWNYINEQNKIYVEDLLDAIIKETESETKKKSIKQSKKYILNNWEGIKRQYDADYIGCSAESHVSHILSSRLSSRPKGWSRVGADQMARLRAFNANKGDIYELMKNKKKENQKERNKAKISKKIIRNKLNTSTYGQIDNITILNTGKRTWAREFLKSIRGA